MVQRVDVYYEGWGEHWHWGTLATGAGPRSPILFEYSDEAIRQGLELSPHTLKLSRGRTFSNFPEHQWQLPGLIYDALPDGWGMLLMDRLFRQRDLDLRSITPLDRLTYIGDTAMGALSFHPADPEVQVPVAAIALDTLAREAQVVLAGKDSALLRQLALMGGSPQGARPKVLVYIDPVTGRMGNTDFAGAQPWLVKFPAQDEHPEVCALEDVYAECARQCGLETPDTRYFPLGDGLAGFGTMRFDRAGGRRVPMHTLAGYTGANYQLPGSCDYRTFQRATWQFTKDMREVRKAFERAVFNVLFNNRDDHPKNFSYLLTETRKWVLAPAYDITYCQGLGGWHQMDVMGAAQSVGLRDLEGLGADAAISAAEVRQTIARFSSVAARLSAIARDRYPGVIRKSTVDAIQAQINQSVEAAGR